MVEIMQRRSMRCLHIWHCDMRTTLLVLISKKNFEGQIARWHLVLFTKCLSNRWVILSLLEYWLFFSVIQVWCFYGLSYGETNIKNQKENQEQNGLFDIFKRHAKIEAYDRWKGAGSLVTPAKVWIWSYYWWLFGSFTPYVFQTLYWVPVFVLTDKCYFIEKHHKNLSSSSAW